MTPFVRACLRILSGVVLSSIAISAPLSMAAEPCNLPEGQEILRELLLIHKDAPDGVRQSLLIQFQSHLLQSVDKTKIPEGTLDEIYKRLYEQVRTEFKLTTLFPGDRHSEVRKYFGQQSIHEAVEVFIAEFNQAKDEEKGQVIEKAVDNIKIKGLLKDRESPQAIEKLHRTLRTWIASNLKPDELRSRLKSIQKVVEAFPENNPIPEDRVGILDFFTKAIDGCEDPTKQGGVLKNLNLYLDEMRSLKIPWIDKVESKMQKRFSFVSRSEKPGKMKLPEGFTREPQDVSGARLVTVWQLDEDLKPLITYKAKPATESAQESSVYYLFPQTRLILEYELDDAKTKEKYPAFVVNVTKNKLGIPVEPVLPKVMLLNKIYIHDDFAAHLVGASPLSECDFVKWSHSYCFGSLITDNDREERIKDLLSLLEISGIAKLNLGNDSSFEERKKALDEVMKKSLDKCQSSEDPAGKEMTLPPLRESYEEFRILFEEHLLKRPERFGEEDLVRLLQKLGENKIAQFQKFAHRPFLNDQYQAVVPNSHSNGRVHLLTVVRMDQ